MPVYAQAWWNGDWSYRKKISLNVDATGIDGRQGLVDVPVLVRLHTGNFIFTDVNQDGSDLRFVASDDKTPVKYHIEQFDPVNELATVWVRVPKLGDGAASDFVWMYFGNEQATAGDDAKGSYDGHQTAVLHFSEKEGAPKDESSYATPVVRSGAKLGVSGQIGHGATLGDAGPVVVGGTPVNVTKTAAGFSVSMWIKPAEPAQSAVLFTRGDAAGSLELALESGQPVARLRGAGGVVEAGRGAALTGGWQRLDLTVGPTLTVYLDGKAIGSANLTAPAEIGGDLAFGADLSGARAFRGDLDEIQLADVVRPAEWIRASQQAAAGDTGFVALGEDEEDGGEGGGSYFGILLHSVTLDGWVVIGILMVMAVISWFVMVGKTVFLVRLNKGNEAFLHQYHQLGRNIAGLHDVTQPSFTNSSLFRVYNVGVRELKHRLELHVESSAQFALTAQAIDAIKATLDASVVKESQKVSAQMVMLTIAIAGGPFLGLLGTVVGVMITFAAIAAAGDVNVNAIAPGIAAALVATVAGLGVAIPALFGYNYLQTRAKDVSANLRIFVDEFVTKMAEIYAP